MGVVHGPLRRRHSGKGRAVPARPPVDPNHSSSRCVQRGRGSHARQLLEYLSIDGSRSAAASCPSRPAHGRTKGAHRSPALNSSTHVTERRRLLVAKSTLQTLEGSLHKFGKHCELILDQLKRPPAE